MIGVDAGATTTRCILGDETGRSIGTGRATGINQNSSGGDPVAHLRIAIEGALGDRDGSAVGGGVLAIAGAGSAGLVRAQRQADEVWLALGLGGRPTVVPDVVATFASGAGESAGSVLVAGTGAIAAVVEDDQVTRRADGYGWLVGDIGSAVWLAREALTAALAALDGRAAPTDLTRPLLAALGATTAQDVVAAVYSSEAAALGRLAPVVTGLAATDATAADIVRRGVAGLLASFDAVAAPAGPTVLGGALLTTDGPVRSGVQQGLAARGVRDVRTAVDAATGAVRLALRH
ncbi:MAG: N-acetylglucosamine kinase [Propionibacteriales bacterium]|nr:N-acetylglucosamine kinase [Propionibacteriales bacterium]